MKFIHFTMISLIALTACNRRSDKTQAETSPTQNGNGDVSLPGDGTPGGSTGGTTLDTRPLAATVSSQIFRCDTLDTGIYWFGKGDMAQKASAGMRSSHFDPGKPTVIYVHGWQAGSHKLGKRGTFNYGKYDPIYGLKVDAADAWIDAGWNIGIFYWNQISDELAPNYAEDKVWGTSDVTWKDCDGKAQPVEGSPASVVDLFYANYLMAMKDYRGDNIRLAGHSLGNQVVTRLAARLADDAMTGTIAAHLVPKRVALLDPWWSAATRTLNRAGSLKASIQTLKTKGMIFEWYRTSDVNENRKSSENLELLPLIGRTEIEPDYYASINQMSRHMSAPFLYFLSFKDPPPKGCSFPCTDLAPSAATSDARMLELMDKAVQWQQTEGLKTAITGDNVFEIKTK